MPTWLLISLWALTVAAAAAVTYLILRRGTPVDRVKLLDSQLRRLREEKAADDLARVNLERAAGELRDKLAVNRAWMAKKLEALDAEVDGEYEALARDDDALLARLGDLLGPGAEPAGEPDG